MTPGRSRAGGRGGYCLGVDLGTTFTAAAVARDHQVEVATLGARGYAIPSVAFLGTDGQVLFGEPAERRSLTDPERVARQFKRRVGDPIPILLGPTPFSSHSLMGKLLAHVVTVVSDREGAPPDRVAFTHPANWGRFRLELVDQMIRQADVGDVTVVTEPEAAARHYASTTRISPGEIVAVYDLGGGTFDATILRCTEAGFELLGPPHGIEQLGGIDFDEAVFAHVLTCVGRTMDDLVGADGPEEQTRSAVARLRRDCVDAKEALSADTEVAIGLSPPIAANVVRLTRGELEETIRPTLVETVETLERAVRAAGIRPDDLKAVLLVGGSSRIPLVAQLLAERLNRPVAIDVHHKHAVALGAARLAASAGEAAEPPEAAPAPTPTARIPTGESPVVRTPMATMPTATVPAATAPAVALATGAVSVEAAPATLTAPAEPPALVPVARPEPGAVWPTSTAYAAVVQDPASAFLDPVLRRATVVTDALGLPFATMGQHVVVFRLDAAEEPLAVRCFVSPPEDGPQRYNALEEHLRTRPCDDMVAARWVEDGIVVDGVAWPVVVMPWASGLPLDAAVAGLRDAPERLRVLADRWRLTVDRLEAAGLDHGDLQHGNVLVGADLTVRLVDLDSVWVPGMDAGTSNENGHPNYQHPGRTRAHWGEGIDLFSKLLIHVSLGAIAAEPALVEHSTGENLLLTRHDLERPGETPVWEALRASSDPAVVSATARLDELCRAPVPPRGRLREHLARASAPGPVTPDPAAAREPAVSLPTLPTRAGEDWWREPADAAATAPPSHGDAGTAGAGAHGVPSDGPSPDTTAPRPPGAATIPRAASSGPPPRPEPSRRPGLLALVAGNVVVSGAIAGAVAGVAGAQLQGAFYDSLTSETEAPLFVAAIAALFGATLNCWQAFGSRSFASGFGRFLSGLVVGAASGAGAVAVADLVATAMVDSDATEAPGVVTLVWVLVAVLVGLAVGALRSVRAAVSGALGGAAGGLVGGWFFAQVSGEFDNGQLLLDGSDPSTYGAAAVAAAVVGLAIGLVSRTLRRATLTIIEGRSHGIEVVVSGATASIGSGGRNTLVLSGDARVARRHAVIDLRSDPAELDAVAEVVVDGQPVKGRRPLEAGAVLKVGGSFVRFERKS